MKILYFVDGLNRGGVEIIVKQLANYFYERNHEIHVVYLYKDMTDLKGEFSKGINFHPLSFDKNKNTHSQYLRNLSLLTKLIKEIKPDIIHAHNSSFSYFFLALSILATGLTINNIRTLHFMGFFLERKNLKDKIRFFFDKLASEILKSSIVSVSPILNCFVEGHYPSNKHYLITNGIDVEKITHNKVSKFNIDNKEHDFIGIYTSRICQGKNHNTLLQAWTQVVKKYPSALLILVGDGPLRVECEEFCKWNGIYKNVLFTGSISNVEDYLILADIGLFPSESEGFGLGLCEMMAGGLPVIASNIPAFKSIIQDGKNGLFYKTYDANDLSAEIINLIEDRNKCDEMGKNAQIYAIQNFSLNSMLHKYDELYRF